MKSLLLKTVFAVLFSALIPIRFFPVQGQIPTAFKSGVIEHRIVRGETLVLELAEYRGSLQWQQSDDGDSWTDWPGQTSPVIQYNAQADIFIRAAVKSENCDPVFSQIVHVVTYELPIVTTAVITGITSTEAKSGGTIANDGGSEVTRRGVCWSESQDPTIDDHYTFDGSGTGSFISSLTGLYPETQYYLRAYAVNEAGTAYGSQKEFKTEASNEGTFTDSRDGHNYSFSRIGTLIWMTENLAWLPEVSTAADGSDTRKHYYVYGYDGTVVSAAKATDNFSIYGVLYNWEAAREACPSGWHLPGDEEWKTLEKHLGMSESELGATGWRTSGNVGNQLKEAGTSHWRNPNSGAINSSGFTALPGGERDRFGTFAGISQIGTFWSSSPVPDGTAWRRHLYYEHGAISRSNTYKRSGLSVRCIKTQ